MLIVGLTGGIGAGKSTVARLLAERGATVIDVDELGRRVLAPNGRAAAAVAAAFGSRIKSPEGTIDRTALANVVFADPKALALLTSISHPAINEELIEELQALPEGRGIVVLDMAVLAESNLGRLPEPFGYRYVVTVEAEPDRREERAVARGSDRDDVRRRMANQADDATRRALADVVITNDGTLDALVRQVDELWGGLQALGERDESPT